MSRRLQKAASAIREVVSMAILAELKDPRVHDVTVTRVEVMPDMRQAKVYVSIMGDDAKQQLALRGLRSSAGFLQSRIADRVDTRYTPRLEFVLDQGVKKQIAIAQILQRVLPHDDAAVDADADFSAASDAEAGADSISANRSLPGVGAPPLQVDDPGAPHAPTPAE
jgi:ribosome-binding factor A